MDINLAASGSENLSSRVGVSETSGFRSMIAMVLHNGAIYRFLIYCAICNSFGLQPVRDFAQMKSAETFTAWEAEWSNIGEVYVL